MVQVVEPVLLNRQVFVKAAPGAMIIPSGMVTSETRVAESPVVVKDKLPCTVGVLVNSAKTGVEVDEGDASGLSRVGVDVPEADSNVSVSAIVAEGTTGVPVGVGIVGVQLTRAIAKMTTAEKERMMGLGFILFPL